MEKILNTSFSRLRDVDPKTERQWQRLQHALTQTDTAAIPRKFQLLPRFALGAAIVAIALLGGYLYFSSVQFSPDTFATGRGEQQEIVLKDGSHVTLNYATKLVVADLRSGAQRQVSLIGEAYFRVRRTETPFIISTAYAEIEVIGTEFNLRARENAVEVAVISGVVKMSAVNDRSGRSLLLTQGQRAICLLIGAPQRIEDISSLDYPGWMHGKLFLDRTSFLEASREIEMRFDVRIAIDDQTVQQKIITGILDAKTAESALSALCELTGNKFTHDGQTYAIY